MDYWENSVQVTLSTAAALLTGLRAAADIAGELGEKSSDADWARAATRLADGIAAGFGRYGYHRLPYPTRATMRPSPSSDRRSPMPIPR